MRLQKYWVFVAVLFASMLGCAAEQDPQAASGSAPAQNQTTPSDAAQAMVIGNITHSGAANVPAGAVIKISLRDVSLADAPSITLAQSEIAGPASFPIAFKLGYEPSEIHPGMTYSMSARIEKDGRLLFINDTSIRVLGRGGKDPHNVVLPVIAVP